MELTSTDANFSGNLWAGSNLQLGSNALGVTVSTILSDQAFNIVAQANGSAYLVTGYMESVTEALHSKAIINYNIDPETVQIVTGNTLGSGANSWSFNNLGDFIVAGNISNGNVVTANYFVGSLANGSSNISMPVINGNIIANVAGNANVVTITGNSLIVGNASGGTLQGANLVSANFISGTFTTSSNAQPNITSVGVLSNLVTTGNLTLAANLYQQGGDPVAATDTTIAYKIPISINGNTYYIALTAAV
jgi:hypothetical protein